MKKFLLIIFLLALIAAGVYFYLQKEGLLGSPGDVVASIDIKKADNLGPMTLFLDYDADTLEVVKVTPGKLAG